MNFKRIVLSHFEMPISIDPEDPGYALPGGFMTTNHEKAYRMAVKINAIISRGDHE